MRGALLVTVGAILIGVANQAVVVHGLIRLAALVGVGLVMLGVALLGWRHRAARGAAVGVVIVVLLVAISPVRTDGAVLQRQMVGEARRFEGVPYVWGGERRDGIDCSGLPRAARRAAALSLAMTAIDPGLVRVAIVDWFVDVPAKGLLAGKGTRQIAVAARADLLPRELLRPGDLICTADGTHVMVVLDEHHVIEADPLPDRVIVAPMNDLKNPWMTTPVVAVRFLDP
jgi:hypothetical protein